MVDLLLAGAAVALLVVVAVVLFRGKRPGRPALAGLVSVTVLAAGTFAVAIYHYATAVDDTPAFLPSLPVAAGPSPAAPGLGTPIQPVEIPMGTVDKLPQGAMWLDPPRPGTDAYTGDLSLLCSTPGKTDHEQNCADADRRVWTVEPLEKRALIAPATGDPFADPRACAVAFKPDYLELTAGRGYCARLAAAPGRTFAFRVPSFPAGRPLPTSLNTEVAALG